MSHSQRAAYIIDIIGLGVWVNFMGYRCHYLKVNGFVFLVHFIGPLGMLAHCLTQKVKYRG